MPQSKEPFPTTDSAAAPRGQSGDAASVGTHDIFMLGWEFPPFISGGLGTACYGLTKAMSRRGDQVLFVLPGPARIGFSAAYETQARSSPPGSGIHMAEFENVEFHGVGVQATDPYARSAHPSQGKRRLPDSPEQHDILDESHKFAERALELALLQRQQGKHFDVVHAHEWMTFEAGKLVARALRVPLIAHVHSTEYDRRAGEATDEAIASAEGDGLAAADAIIAVSRYTAGQIARNYGIDISHITVIHNALDLDSRAMAPRPTRIGAQERVVLFVGRMTQQKGPELFVRAAARVLAHEPAVRFVMAGTGEQFTQIGNLARRLEIDQHFLFTGFLRGEDIDALYRAADVLVMPSVSEPFGLVSLEAMGRDVPVIVSNQSGAAEVLQHALKVDFWDLEDIAAKILAVLRDPLLAEELSGRGSFEVRQMRWSDAADAVAQLYDRLLRNEVAA